MKINLLSFLGGIILFAVCSKVTNKKSDLNEMNLLGKVKSFREVSYKAEEKGGEIVKGKKERMFTAFEKCTSVAFEELALIKEKPFNYERESQK